MSFKRRSRHLMKPSRPRRKTEWEGFNLQWLYGSTLPLNWIHTFWAKWPSATLDPSLETFPVDYVTDVNDTLVASVLQYGFTVRSADVVSSNFQVPVQAAVGLIAYETQSPGSYDNGVWKATDSGYPPDPSFNWGADWIWRDTRPVFANAIAGADWSFLGLLDRDQQTSRAMRKLPAQTGLLWCTAFHTNLAADDEKDIMFSGFAEGRLLLKKH